MPNLDFLFKNRIQLDCHCHLYNCKTDLSFIKNNPHIKWWLSNSLNSKQLAWHKNLKLQQVLLSAGAHPLFLDNSNHFIDEIYQNAKQNTLFAIGEIGLDKQKNNINEQTKILIKQLEIAKKFNLPVILHCVNAYQELYAILKQFKSLNYIFHGFNKNIQILKQFARFNMVFSISNALLSNNSKKNLAIAIKKSNNYVFETDAENLEDLPKINQIITKFTKLA